MKKSLKGAWVRKQRDQLIPSTQSDLDALEDLQSQSINTSDIPEGNISDFERVNERVQADMVRLRTLWNLFEAMFLADKTIQQALFSDRTAETFNVIRSALFDEALLRIARLLDTERGYHQFTIERVIRLSNLTEIQRQEGHRILSDLRTKFDDVRTHRDKRIAHAEDTDLNPMIAPLGARVRSLVDGFNGILRLMDEGFGVPDMDVERSHAELLAEVLNKGNQALGSWRPSDDLLPLRY